MSVEEAMAWQAYMKKYGLLNIGTRLEYGFALIATQINRALGGNKEMADFMPHYKPEPASIEEVFAMLNASSKAKKD